MLIMPPWTVSALGFHKKISTMETWEEQRLHKHQRQSSNTQFTLRNNGMDSGPSWLLGLLWQENIIWVWEKLNLNIIIQIIYLTRHLEEKKKNRDQPARILTIGLYYWGSCTQYSSVTVFKMRRWQDFPTWDVGQESFLVCFCRSSGVENEKMSFKNYLKYDFSQGLKDACQKDADSRAEAWRKRKSSCLKVQWKDEF